MAGVQDPGTFLRRGKMAPRLQFSTDLGCGKLAEVTHLLLVALFRHRSQSLEETALWELSLPLRRAF